MATPKYKFPDKMNAGLPSDWPSGSTEWANAVALQLSWQINRADYYGVKDLVETLELIEGSAVPPWTVWPPGRPCRSPERFMELSCGHTVAQMKSMIAVYRPDLRLRFWDAMTPASEAKGSGGDHKSQAFLDQTRNTSLKFSDNTSYALARLKRDRPDLAKRVLADELSAHAAAIEAGFRKKTITVRVDKLLSTLQGVWKHATEEERRSFLEWIKNA